MTLETALAEYDPALLQAALAARADLYVSAVADDQVRALRIVEMLGASATVVDAQADELRELLGLPRARGRVVELSGAEQIRQTGIPGQYETAREARDAGEAIGLEGQALDLYVRAGAAHRARLRTARAKDALLAEASKLGEDVSVLIAILLATLDEVGVGGTLGATGARTDRLPCLRGLGSGRKQARDGAAWTAAIRHAALSFGVSVFIQPIQPGQGLEPGLLITRQFGPELPYNDFAVPLTALGDETRPWVDALARRQITKAGGLEVPPLEGAGFVDDSHASLPGWGALLTPEPTQPEAGAQRYQAVEAW